LTDHETRISENRSDITQLQSDVSVNTANIAVNAGNIAVNTGDVADLTTRLGTFGLPDAGADSYPQSVDTRLRTTQLDIYNNADTLDSESLRLYKDAGGLVQFVLPFDSNPAGRGINFQAPPTTLNANGGHFAVGEDNDFKGGNSAGTGDAGDGGSFTVGGSLHGGYSGGDVLGDNADAGNGGDYTFYLGRGGAQIGWSNGACGDGGAFLVEGALGGDANSSNSTIAGRGSTVTLNGGNGGAALQNNANGGHGGNVWLSPGEGGAGHGTGVAGCEGLSWIKKGTTNFTREFNSAGGVNTDRSWIGALVHMTNGAPATITLDNSMYSCISGAKAAYKIHIVNSTAHVVTIGPPGDAIGAATIAAGTVAELNVLTYGAGVKKFYLK
jgi:hypothetical protein